MRFAFDVGDTETARVVFSRSPWVGTMHITADGQQVAFVDPTRLSTHFDFKWVKRYTFVVGRGERHEVTIEHERPVLLGGLQPNTYRVFVDGCVTEEHHGY
jgi:hypothetical protein